jgi:hypothetical protein
MNSMPGFTAGACIYKSTGRYFTWTSGRSVRSEAVYTALRRAAEYECQQGGPCCPSPGPGDSELCGTLVCNYPWPQYCGCCVFTESIFGELGGVGGGAILV